jgi:uncharacterized protein YndB with AHSA1/START domain
MTNNLFFDFIADKANNKILVTREFAASHEKVWAAWTQPEILDLWWAPKPYVTITKLMDFKEGGCWLYAMKGPTGDVHWCKADYKSIKNLSNYSALDAFCDENGNINAEFPRSFWSNTFHQNDKTTTVKIEITYEKLEDLEKIIELGFKEGFTMAMTNLDQVLAS